MISIEALAMVVLAAAAVFVAYTKLSCNPEDPRIAWLPDEAAESAEPAFPSGR